MLTVHRLEPSLVSSLSLPAPYLPLCLLLVCLPTGFFGATILLPHSECFRLLLRFLGDDCISSTMERLAGGLRVLSAELLSELGKVSSSLKPGPLPALSLSASELSRFSLMLSSEVGDEPPVLSSLGEPVMLEILESGVVGGVLSITGAASLLSRRCGGNNAGGMCC